MRAHGWREHPPAIEDQNHVILTGHRRLLVCEELNAEGLDIKPRDLQKALRRWRGRRCGVTPVRHHRQPAPEPLSDSDRWGIARNLCVAGVEHRAHRRETYRGSVRGRAVRQLSSKSSR